MIRIRAIAFVILFSPFFLQAQKYVQSTFLGFGYGYGSEAGAQIFQIDNGGNAYVMVATRGQVNVFGKTYTAYGSSYSSVFAKISAAGKLIWARQLGGPNEIDQTYDLQIDDNKNVYISGAGGNIVLDDGTALDGGTFLIKFDSNGKTLWGVSATGYNGSAQIGGPIAVTNDGVFWSSIFYGRLDLAGHVLQTNNPNGGSPDGFVARVTADGKVTGVYHDPALSSIPQIIVPSDNGNATVIMTRGGTTKARVLLDKNAAVISDQPFVYYGDFPYPTFPTTTGYEMITPVYKWFPNGPEDQGYFDIHFDKQLNITDSVNIWPVLPGKPYLYNTIAYQDKGYFSSSNLTNSYDHINWVFLDSGGNLNVLPQEDPPGTYQDVYTRTPVKVVGDTLNMLIRHANSYVDHFTFNGQAIQTDSYQDASFFWVKFIPDASEDPDSCKRIKASVIQNGIEGSKDVIIRLNLLKSCPALEDITVKLTQPHPELNENDFVMPDEVVIKKGDTAVNLTIKVVDDQVVENLEQFGVNLHIGTTTNGYSLTSGSSNLSFTITDNDNTDANRQYSISYTPEINEGSSGTITVSLPPSVVLSGPLQFTFNPSPVPYAATPGADYTPLNIAIPAGANSVQFKVDAFNDNLIEGDEFIAGSLSPAPGNLGKFTTADSTLTIKIIDAQNTPQNRVIYITPATDFVSEGSAVTYTLQLAQPYKLQYPLSITTAQAQWYNYLQQSAESFTLDSTNTAPAFTITYPDDNVIRADKLLKLVPAAADGHLGSFSFSWKNAIIDTMAITAIDNDGAYAQLELSPLKMVIPEGASDTAVLQIAGGRVLENDLRISYQWAGAGITDDARILSKSGSLVLHAGQNGLQVPVNILKDQQVDPFNQRTLNFTISVGASGLTSIQPQAFVDVTIVDADGKTLHIPNTFTPNGDGVNDTWNIANLGFDPQCMVTVYDRYGPVVFSSRGYPAPWDGTENGHVVPVGTYYYIITYHGIKFSGTVTIIR